MIRAPILAAMILPVAVPSAAAPAVRAHFKAETFARVGQTVRLGNVRVTPLKIVEDSRCPRLVTCVWRGRLRITASVNGQKMTLDDGVTVKAAHGHLTLVDATPLSETGERIAVKAYRFRLRFER